LWADNGTYEADLNRALRLMPSYGVRSLRSVRAYADVYVAAGRFLQGQPEPKTLWEATRNDFNVLFTVRRVDLATRQSKATWNLWVAALDKLYQIGVDEGLVAANPFHEGSAPSEGATAGRWSVTWPTSLTGASGRSSTSAWTSTGAGGTSGCLGPRRRCLGSVSAMPLSRTCCLLPGSGSRRRPASWPWRLPTRP